MQQPSVAGVRAKLHSFGGGVGGGVAYSRSVQSNPQTAGVGAGLQSNRTRRQPDSTCLIS